MKRTLMTLVPALLLGFGSAAFAADAAAKPDCTTQQKAAMTPTQRRRPQPSPIFRPAQTRRGRTRPAAKSP
jgi:hypothetical protein